MNTACAGAVALDRHHITSAAHDDADLERAATRAVARALEHYAARGVSRRRTTPYTIARYLVDEVRALAPKFSSGAVPCSEELAVAIEAAGLNDSWNREVAADINDDDNPPFDSLRICGLAEDLLLHEEAASVRTASASGVFAVHA